MPVNHYAYSVCYKVRKLRKICFVNKIILFNKKADFYSYGLSSYLMLHFKNYIIVFN